MLRSVMVTALGIFGLIFLSLWTGYGLRGLKRRDQVLWYNVYTLRMIIPPMLVILPQFMIMQWLLGLIPGYDRQGFVRHSAQLLALVILYIKGGAVPTMLFTTAISEIPKEIEESAEIDGANPLRYFFHILLPLMKVPIAGLVVIYLPFIWNDFLQPYVYLDPTNTTMLPLIQGYSGQYSTNFQVTYTAVFLSVIPLVLIYVLFRRWFVRGALAGAVKG
jgi:ABC-type glycerol-3-phosphate transport system permease component